VADRPPAVTILADDDPTGRVPAEDPVDGLLGREVTPAKKDCPIAEYHSAMATYARVSRAPFPVRRRSLLEIVRRADSDALMLEQELTVIQERLGTPVEQPGDLDRATAVGHQLTNLMWQALVMQELTAHLTTVPFAPPEGDGQTGEVLSKL
jgi:hypothetical protein